jgi:excisionase family DNA binding protein
LADGLLLVYKRPLNEFENLKDKVLMAYLDRTQEGLEAFMTVAEAARYLGVGRKIVYQLVEFERIRSLRRGRVLWVDKGSLDEFQRSGQMV